MDEHKCNGTNCDCFQSKGIGIYLNSVKEINESIKEILAILKSRDK